MWGRRWRWNGGASLGRLLSGACYLPVSRYPAQCACGRKWTGDFGARQVKSRYLAKRSVRDFVYRQRRRTNQNGQKRRHLCCDSDIWLRGFGVCCFMPLVRLEFCGGKI